LVRKAGGTGRGRKRETGHTRKGWKGREGKGREDKEYYVR